MPALPLHPAVVHIPVALALLLPLLAFGVVLAWARRWLPSRAWLLVVALQAVTAVGALAALQTGEREEDRVETVVSSPAIEAHEHAAKWFSGAAALVLGLAVMAALVKPERLSRGFAFVTAGASVVVALLAVDAGRKGGELVYRHGAAAAYSAPAGGPAGGGLHSERKDDD